MLHTHRQRYQPQSWMINLETSKPRRPGLNPIVSLPMPHSFHAECTHAEWSPNLGRHPNYRHPLIRPRLQRLHHLGQRHRDSA